MDPLKSSAPPLATIVGGIEVCLIHLGDRGLTAHHWAQHRKGQDVGGNVCQGGDQQQQWEPQPVTRGQAWCWGGGASTLGNVLAESCACQWWQTNLWLPHPKAWCQLRTSFSVDNVGLEQLGARFCLSSTLSSTLGIRFHLHRVPTLMGNKRQTFLRGAPVAQR